MYVLFAYVQGFVGECLSVMSDQLNSFKANEVAVSLWAVARLRGQPDMRLMAAALQHCFSQVRFSSFDVILCITVKGNNHSMLTC